MIPIKIQCPCGQRYAFDVEPVAGQMPGSIACPICGADGTGMANAAIAQRLGGSPAFISVANASDAFASPGGAPPSPLVPSTQNAQSGRASIRVAAADPDIKLPPPPTSARTTAPLAPEAPKPAERPRLPGQMDPERAQAEARSKIMWGDDPKEVTKFLLSQGLGAEEASGLLASLLNQRAEAVRKTGVHKIFVGAGMMCVPVIAFVVFRSIGVFPLKLFGAAIVVGVWGAWRVISGVIMMLSPRSEKGDLADM